ncbi:MAG: hypothetical protein HQL85_19290 [Magnetococcales bacterium]|nr:hypothetical protein [Magnetococcales bacterium]
MEEMDDEFEERLAIIEIDGGIPFIIAYQLAKLCVNYKPNSLTDKEWSEFFNETASQLKNSNDTGINDERKRNQNGRC